jgi:hypothetical protein
MKTTLNFDDELLREAKARAARDGESLTRLIERALKLYLRLDRVGEIRPTYRWEPVTKRGPARPGVDLTRRDDWIDLLDDDEDDVEGEGDDGDAGGAPDQGTTP